ncbi:hepatocyte nuclear factor 1-alpha-like isoform X2 [Xyrauchen texanus]|uniref:hepatocyte nuclear factor 1-alpha-like isoform X2 n=1 Tax=Xyrauchen texanus TaxID=154827 RepID=UPI002241BA1A|nr:hepatocyte nuclear factor 1-alpha-like isoform X2 [Xyrauchen texanus]
MNGRDDRRAGGERSSQLSALQEQLVWSLLGSGLSKELLIQAMGDLEREQALAGVQRADRADGESSEEGEMDNPPPIFRELEGLPPEENARQRGQVDRLLQEDSWHVAKMVKSYMQQHNLPQREVVESTGLNQSHLSQHLNKGTPMKNQKRAMLYSWYVKKQAEISQQFTNASRGEESGEDGRKGRRNRFKWGPASQQILFQAYERQKNPSKEEREGLVEECNRAECLQRGVSPSQLAGLGYNLVTEVRVYNWFANRRKEEAFRHKLALDTAYNSQSAPSTGQTLPSSPSPGLKYTRDRGGGGRIGASPVQLVPSHTLLDTHHHKPASGGGSLPPVSTLTSLHGVSGSSNAHQGLIMASLPSVVSLRDSSLLIGLTSSQTQTVPVINNMGGGFTTLQQISFQQQLHTGPQQPIAQQLQGHISPSSFMTTMAQLPVSHMYSKADLTCYPSSSLLSQAMVIADSNSIGTLTNLTAIRQILASDPEDHTDTPSEDESLHLQSTSPEPVSSGSLELYPQMSETHPSHLLSSSPGDIDPYNPTQMVSTAQ